MSFASDVKNEVARLDSEAKKENALNCSDFCGSVDPFPYQGKKWAFIYDGNAALARRVLRLLKITLLFRPKSL